MLDSSATAAGPPHIVVVDDDHEIGLMLSKYLGGQGFRVSVVESGERLRATMREHSVDLLLLDLGLPDEDGLNLIRFIRNQWHGPVIIISGRGESVERVVGLELGADDFVTKPFDLRELLARIRSVLRRAAQAVPPIRAALAGFEFCGMHLDTRARRLVDRDGREVGLTAGEFELLLAMLERPNQVLSRDQLMNAIHGRNAGPYDRSIDVQIGRLRRKLEDDPSDPQLIKSVRGSGYFFAASVRTR